LGAHGESSSRRPVTHRLELDLLILNHIVASFLDSAAEISGKIRLRISRQAALHLSLGGRPDVPAEAATSFLAKALKPPSS
jgi:hypothetical protein